MAKMHAYQLPGCIVDKDQQDAWRCSILEPPVVRSVDLDQFAKAWSAQSWLLDLGLALGSSPLPRNTTFSRWRKPTFIL
jgi:hypothetical protein